VSYGGKWQSIVEITMNLGDIISLRQSVTSNFSFYYSSLGNNTKCTLALYISYRLNAQISSYSHNITALYMFRAILCSSSGGHTVYTQHMVSSLSMSGRGVRAVHMLSEMGRDEVTGEWRRLHNEEFYDLYS
jgi:hypothetical protein